MTSPRSPLRVELDEGSERRATPFTRVWYIASLILGVALLVSGVYPRWEPSLALASLPDWVALVVGLAVVGGSILLIYGSSTHVLLSLSWALEQMGCTIAGAGWLALSIGAAWSNPLAVLSWGMALSMSISLMSRWRSLRRREEVTRAVVESQGDGNV